MHTKDWKKGYDAWVTSRPESIQKLIAEFPPNTRVFIGDKVNYILGFGEDDTLIITEIDPLEDYEKAFMERKLVNAEDFRGTQQRMN